MAAAEAPGFERALPGAYRIGRVFARGAKPLRLV
jgi:hypothetical protein